jgi:gliding motility-associated-like protein
MKNKFYLYLILLFCSSLKAQISDFDQGIDDWQANDDAQNDQVYWAAGFGNPAPSIFAIDDNTGQPWYFVAPPCFIGNRGYLYGKSLKYDLFTNDMQANIAYKNDVILFGANGLNLYHDHAYRPNVSEWTAFEVFFIESEWHKNNSTGSLASQAELESVLANIADLHILGEFKTGPDQAWLDNVYMGETPSVTLLDTICNGNSYQIGTYIHTETGTYTDLLQSISGCDSAIVVLDLQVLPIQNTDIERFICDGNSVILPDGSETSLAGIYPFFFTSIAGCDSIVTVEVKVADTYLITQNKKICQGETYVLSDGVGVFEPDTYFSLGTSIAGCDSNLTTILTVLDTFFGTKSAIICENEAFTLPNGTQANASGSFIFRYKNAAGCDSTLQVDLTVLDSILVEEKVNICANDSYFLPDGTLATVSGGFTYSYPRSNGCDSTFILNLNIVATQDTILDVTRREGEEYLLPDGTFIVDSNLVKDFVLSNALGCDSVVRVNLRYVFYRIFVPNAFSPEGDGVNDFFSIFTNQDTKIILQLNIYDRWGELIFSKENFAPNQESLGWDGTYRSKKAQPGVYTYWAKVEFIDGEKRFISGDVVLVR